MSGESGKGDFRDTPEKTYTLKEVIEGLKQGKRFERESTNAVEYVTPWGEGMFKHDVVGEDQGQGGWGGSTQLTISTLENGRWNKDGWKLVK
jgi:hypothetical protein